MLLWSSMLFYLVVVFISMMCIQTFHVSIIAPNAAMVVHVILLGGSIYIHDVYTDFPCINLAPNAAMVVHVILFGGSIYIHDVYRD